jgi:LacI family transcriptional regulator
MPARMKDIAQQLGVSVVTVSKSLRGLPGPSQETRARVIALARELNYGPNLAARALVTGHTNSIGLVIPDLVHPFFAQIAKSVSAVLNARGYGLLVSSSEENPELERRAVEQLVARSVDGILIASTQGSADVLRWVENHGIPYVLIDRRFEGLDAIFVGVDDVRVGALATAHLIEMGCQRIAHIGGGRLSSALGRREGYEKTLIEHGLPRYEEYLVLEELVSLKTGGSGHSMARKLLSLDPRPDGIFCYNDRVAMDTLLACLEAGLQIPEDIAVVGCGNSHYDDFLRVPLSSIDQKSEAIGCQAAQSVLAWIESGLMLPARTYLLEPQLIIRKSSQRRLRPA